MTLLISFLIIAVIGSIAQRIGICMIKAVNQALDGNAALLLAILVSGCWLWVYFLVSHQFGLDNNVPRYVFHPIFLLGGFVFGVGAGMNQACSVSTMNHLTKGDLRMLLTVLGWFVGWYVWMNFSMNATWYSSVYQENEPLSNQSIFLLFVPAFLFTLQRLVFKPEQRNLWFGIMAFGILATTLFLLQPDWPPGRLIQDTGEVIVDPANNEWPSAPRYVLMLGLLLGMLYVAVTSKMFTLVKVSIRSIPRYLSAGTLMGIGGAMALGGNDTHLLLGLPTLSLASVATIAGMIAGIATQRFLYKRLAVG